MENIGNENNEFPESQFFSKIPFTSLSLSPSTLESLKENNFEYTTPVQLKCIPEAMKGIDIMCTAKTGSGKTLAFLIPSLELLIRTDFCQSQGVGVLVISPTRELALQIYDVAKKVFYKSNKKVGVIIGGGYRKKEAEMLIKGVNLLIATPGRLLDHLTHTNNFNCNNLCLLIIDEADVILKNGFEEETKKILQILPKDRQTMLFSATLNKKVQNLNTLSMSSTPIYIKIESSNNSINNNYHTIKSDINLEQGYIIMTHDIKFSFLYTFLKRNSNKKIMIFFSTCKEVEFYSLVLNYVGTKVRSIHGDLKQRKREQIYRDYFSALKGILLCTDVAQRGLDFPSVDYIIQYDCPLNVDEYLHRVGRTARGPNGKGKALLFLFENEKKIIDEINKRNILIKQFSIKDSIINISDKFISLIESNPVLKDMAIEAYKSYKISILYNKDNNINDDKIIDDEKICLCFGLKNVKNFNFNISFNKIKKIICSNK